MLETTGKIRSSIVTTAFAVAMLPPLSSTVNTTVFKPPFAKLVPLKVLGNTDIDLISQLSVDPLSICEGKMVATPLPSS